MRIWFSFFLVFLLSAHAEPLKIDVSATGAILINADTGVVLFEKEPHLQLYPASTTKIATALYSLQKLGNRLDTHVTAPRDCVATVNAAIRQAPDSRHPSYRLEPEGTHMGLKADEQLPLETLFYGLLLQSGNDAANVIAQHVSGSIPLFMDELNAYLARLGLKNTHFNNPHGLFHPEHYTTPADLAKIAQTAMQNPKFREIVRTVECVRPASNKQEESRLVQHNRLLKKGKWHYPKAIGIKTGYILKAGNTFVGAAEHEGRTLIAVVMKCPGAENMYKDATSLFEAAFSQKKLTRTLFAKGYDEFSTELKEVKLSLKAFLAENVEMEYYPAEEPQFQVYLQWNEIALPIVQGQRVGELRLVDSRGQAFQAASLFAAHDIDKTFMMKALDYTASPVFKGVLLFILLGAAFFIFILVLGKGRGNRRV